MSTPLPCPATPRQAAEQATERVDQVFARVQARWPDKIELLRPIDYFCDTECPAIKDGLWLYASRIHWTLAGSNLMVSRAADVVLKEKRRLVLAVRETPLHAGHLRTMTQLAEMGAIIAPVVPAFYNRPKSLDDIINHTVGRLLDLFDIDASVVKRWQGGPEEEE